MEPIALSPLEDQLGTSYVGALRKTIGWEEEEVRTVQVWGSAKAKDHFSEVVTLALEGERRQIVRRRSDEPVLVMSMGHLASFVAKAAPLRRFALMIVKEPESDLGTRYGVPFTNALRHTMEVEVKETAAFRPWGVAKAKGHFREMLDRVLEGESQLVRRRRDEPVLLTTVAQLADFVEHAPKQRFADLIAHDPQLPVGSPLEVSEAATGFDKIEI